MEAPVKLTFALVAVLLVSACSGDYPTRTTTVPPPAQPPYLWVVVQTEAGSCITGATVQVVEGQRMGEALTQDPCDGWESDVGGVGFNNLEAGVPMTVRATAAGYTTQEKTFTPIAGSPGPSAIRLSRNQPTPTDSSAFVWGMVIPVGSGVCIKNATVEVVRGQRTGETITQEPCDVWDFGGGFELKNLTPGVEMTLRASAPGYVTKDFVITPVPLPHGAIFLELSPTQ